MTFWRPTLLRILSWYLRHAPSHRGRWRLARLTVSWSPLLKATKRARIIKVREGFRLVIDGTSQTGRIAYATGRYEPRTTALIKTLVAPGDVVVDVGANIGYFAIVAARAAGRMGSVMAFEPVPDVRQRLIRNLQLNRIEQVEVFSHALSDSSANVLFYQGPDQDTGLGSLRPLDHARQIPVQQIRFDELWDRRRKISLVKIDVEGGELRVLKGMRECLARDRPELVLEITDEYLRALGDSAEALLTFLTTLDYRVYEIAEEGPLRPVHASQLVNCPPQFNAVCLTTGGQTRLKRELAG